MMRVKNRFYVGSRAIGINNECGWALPTLELAISKAKKQLEDDPDQESAIVVQIIRVIRKAHVPTVVEKVTG